MVPINFDKCAQKESLLKRGAPAEQRVVKRPVLANEHGLPALVEFGDGGNVLDCLVFVLRDALHGREHMADCFLVLRNVVRVHAIC